MSAVASSRTFRALDFGFVVECDDPALLAYLEHVMSGLPETDGAVSRYAITRLRSVPHVRYALTLDGDAVADHEQPESFVGSLVHDVNRQAIDRWSGLALHAGGVARDGIALAFPAHMESGKSTLTAGLVRAGFDYLSDEAVAFAKPDDDPPVVCPYPKPLSLDPGSWSLFPELEPDAPLASDAYRAAQWQVPPGAIRARPVAEGGPIHAIVFPHYEAGARTVLDPMHRGEGLVELAKNTFRFNERPRRSLDALARVMRFARPYRLTVGSLAAAVDVVTELHAELASEAIATHA